MTPDLWKALIGAIVLVLTAFAAYIKMRTGRFTIPKDSSTGVDTMYTLFEDSVVYPFANYSAASVGPFVVVSAPGFSYTNSLISGTDSPVTIVRGTLGISFF